MEYKVFKKFEDLSKEFEGYFDIAMQNPVANVALSGGSVVKLYKDVAEGRDWTTFIDNQIIWTTDERFVPYEHEHSNAKQIFEAFSKYGSILNFVYFDTKLEVEIEAEDLLLDSAHNNEKKINIVLNEYEMMLSDINVAFDLCVLGVGSDGHIASLFPGSTALDEYTRLVAHTQTEQFDIKDRLTITYPQILKSKKILLVMQGSSKKEVYEKIKAANLDFHEFPVNKLHEHSDVTVLYGDF
jgi:6-phosphogluconolactonase/glucosamine-6-phosphate isomerase/deaminase